MTQEEKAKAYDEALEKTKELFDSPRTCFDINQLKDIFPQLRESDDERIMKDIVAAVEMHGDLTQGRKSEIYAYLEKQKDAFENGRQFGIMQEQARQELEWPDEKQKEQKLVKIEVYEVGKGTTICGQDYKCKKDYKEGNCWYIKDVIYHCSRDGYLTDQNGVSWSCTPEWFNEYIYTNNELADKEKNDFVSGQFLQCKLSFDEFKEGEHYWLEYVDDDTFVGRSDNILNQKFHITPRQLYTLFSQQLEEVQGPPQEERQVPLTYEPPFDENPSDKEIIEALIHHLNEQDGFLIAINCVNTKAILSWLKKQKERKPAEWSEEEKTIIEGACSALEVYGHTKLANKLKSLRPQPHWKPSEEQMKALQHAIDACESEWAYQDDELRSLLNDLKKL